MKVNYVICTYMGKRRNRSIAAVDMIRMHLDFLQNNAVDLARVTVVCNVDLPEDFKVFLSYMKPFTDKYYTDLVITQRENRGFSYGAWNDTINQCFKNKEKFSHFFLIEDDYIPDRKDFLNIFLKKAKGKVAYVCSKAAGTVVVNRSEWYVIPTDEEIVMNSTEAFQWHPAMSNGLLVARFAHRAYSKNGSAFKINNDPRYVVGGEGNQIKFLDYITDCGFELVDCSDLTSTPFFERFSYEQVGRIIEYGNSSEPPAIIPILRKETIDRIRENQK